jgi:hypothetical protein
MSTLTSFAPSSAARIASWISRRMQHPPRRSARRPIYVTGPPIFRGHRSTSAIPSAKTVFGQNRSRPVISKQADARQRLAPPELTNVGGSPMLA